MKQFFRALALFAAVFALQSSQAATEQTKGEAEVDYRQSLYTVIAGNFHPLGAMAEGKMAFNAAEAKLRAERVAFLVPMLKEAFPADSNGVGHTSAKPEIWTDAAGFDKALQLLSPLQSAALALSKIEAGAVTSDEPGDEPSARRRS